MAAATTPEQSLARDKQLAKQFTPVIQDTFDREYRRIQRDRTDLRETDWVDVLTDVWVVAGNSVFADTYELYTREPVPTEARQKQQLVALIAEIIQDSNSAETIARHIEESAAGIVKTSRKRIGTVLRRLEGSGAGARRVSRALRRLYKTEFVKKRANRIALDQVLRATATYEHGAALLARETTGREYLQVWRNQGDDRVRDSHIGVLPVTLGENFKVGISELRFPRDPAGPASETYGCRCWTERRRL